MPDIVPVILCGGSGTRLWPLSRETYPKQFVDMGDGATLFKSTVQRARRTPGCAEPVIVCNESHRFYVTAELYACGVHGKILLEPAPRNTAPAIALAACALQDDGADPLMLVLPSDHIIGDESVFFEGVRRAAALADKGFIVTFGIAPTGPETGFGYIEQGESLEEGAFCTSSATGKATRASGQSGPDGGCRVARFVEKPAADVARAMLAQGGYLWNSGMFLLRASVYLAELERFAPRIYAAARAEKKKQKHGLQCCLRESAGMRGSAANPL